MHDPLFPRIHEFSILVIPAVNISPLDDPFCSLSITLQKNINFWIIDCSRWNILHEHAVLLVKEQYLMERSLEVAWFLDSIPQLQILLWEMFAKFNDCLP